jgi:hypothetical protein
MGPAGRLRELVGRPWRPLGRQGLIGWAAGFGLLVLVLLLDDDGFVVVLDHANLAFHEAGHLFFGLFGATLHLYGGTLGQLVFPAAGMGAFWARRETLGLAACWVWLFQNLRYVATYMADAPHQVLPRVGGGGHDWWLIFRRWDALEHAGTVAGVTLALSWLGMLAACGWVLLRYARERAAGGERTAG